MHLANAELFNFLAAAQANFVYDDLVSIIDQKIVHSEIAFVLASAVLTSITVAR